MHDATNFWLLSGTSAPVIALANAVVVGDTYKLTLDLISIRGRSSTATTRQKKLAKNALWLAGPTTIMGLLNYLLQATAFLNALVFFSAGESNESATSVKWTLFYGMGVLFLASAFSSIARHLADEMNRASPESPPEEQPDLST
jgi:hypothetical protein